MIYFYPFAGRAGCETSPLSFTPNFSSLGFFLSELNSKLLFWTKHATGAKFPPVQPARSRRLSYLMESAHSWQQLRYCPRITLGAAGMSVLRPFPAPQKRLGNHLLTDVPWLVRHTRTVFQQPLVANRFCHIGRWVASL